MRIKLNALDRDSSGSHSKEVIVGSMDKFREEAKAFEGEVPFPRWYPDHEFVSGSDLEKSQFENSTC